jgi:hypothetical protein
MGQARRLNARLCRQGERKCGTSFGCGSPRKRTTRYARCACKQRNRTRRCSTVRPVEDVLKVVGAVVAVVASLAAVAVTVEQLTLRSRLRKTEAWSTAQLATEKDAERVAVLDQLRLDATARLVAGHLLPVRHYAEGALFSAAAPAAIVSVLRDEEVTAGGAWALSAIVFAGLLLGARRAARVYCERCRIASEYGRAQRVTSPRLGLTDGSLTKIEFLFAAVYSSGLCALATGLGLALLGERVDGWPLVLMLIGGSLAVRSIEAMRVYVATVYPL